jgi:transposase
MVAAPGKIERPVSDRVKTDRRDAERLLRLLMIGSTDDPPLERARSPSDGGPLSSESGELDLDLVRERVDRADILGVAAQAERERPACGEHGDP